MDQLGYRSFVSDTFDLMKNERWETLLWVMPVPVALDPLAVTVHAEAAALKKVGFYDREKLSAGYMVDPEKVRRERPDQTHELLQGIPGVQLASNSMGTGYLVLGSPHRLLASNGDLAGTCPMAIVVDGQRIRQSLAYTIDDMVDAQDVLAVEVYPHGGVGAPVQYVGLDADCGVVLIWTKEKR